MAYINNQVVVTKNGVKTNLTQTITTNKNTTSDFIQFKDEKGNPLFSIHKDTPSVGTYSLEIFNPADMKDENGNPLSTSKPLIYTFSSSAANSLKLCEHRYPNGVMTQGQEIELQVSAGVKLVANARGVGVIDGTTKYSRPAPKDKTYSMDISDHAIESWLNGINGFEQAGDYHKDFPLPLLGLYIKGNFPFATSPSTPRVLGNYEIYPVVNPKNATSPYIFIKNQGQTYLFTNGYPRKVENFITLRDHTTNEHSFALQAGGSTTYYQLHTDQATCVATENLLTNTFNFTNQTGVRSKVRRYTVPGWGISSERADSRELTRIISSVSAGVFNVSENSASGQIGNILMMINIFKEQITIIINEAGDKIDNNLQEILKKLGEHEDLLKKILAQTEQNGADIKNIQAAISLLGVALDKILENQTKLEGIVTGIDAQVKANGKALEEQGLKIEEILRIVKGLEGVPGKLVDIEKKLIESIQKNDDNFNEVFKQLTTIKENQAEMRKSLDAILDKLSKLDEISEDLQKLIDSLKQFKEEINQRFDKLEQRIDRLEDTIKEGFNGVNNRLDKLDENQIEIYNILESMGIDVKTLVTKTGELDLSVKNIGNILTTLSKNFDAYAKRTDKRFDQLLNALGLNTKAIEGVKKGLGLAVGSLLRIEDHLGEMKDEQKKTNETLDSINGNVEKLEAGQQQTNNTLGAILSRLDGFEASSAEMMTAIIFMMSNPANVPGTTINNTTNNTNVDIYSSSTTSINQTQQNLTFLTAQSNANVQSIIKLINQSFDNINVCINQIKADETKTLTLMTGIKAILTQISQYVVDLKKENVAPMITMLIDKQIINVTNIITNIETEYNKNVETERVSNLPDNKIKAIINIEEFGKLPLKQMLAEYYSFFNKIVDENGNTTYPLTHNAKQKIEDLKKAITLQQTNLQKLYVQLGKYNDNPSEDTKKEILKLVRELRLNQQVMRDYKDQLKGMEFFDKTGAAKPEDMTDEETKKLIGQMSDKIDEKTDKVLAKAEEMQKEKEEEKEEDKGPKEIKHDYKKHVEYISNALFPVSAVLIALACLTPFGIFALIPGIALAATCVLGNVYADKFVYSTWEYAHKQLSEQEKQELEDQEQLGKFMEKQAELEKMEENIKIFAEGRPVEHVDEHGNRTIVREDGLQQSFEEPELEPLIKLYNTHGIGFNATPNPDGKTRSTQLLGKEGHNIRMGWYEQLAIITNDKISNEDRGAAANKFIDDNFGPDITADERQEVYKLLMSDNEDDQKALKRMTTRIKLLNEEEEKYNALLSETKVDISRMPDYLIAKALGSPELDAGNRRQNFIKRYGPTLVRRYALDDRMSQAKLDLLFSEVPESVKPQCVEQMMQIAEEVFNSIEALEKFSEESKKKHDDIALGKTVGHTIHQLNTTPVALQEDLSNEMENYFVLQSYRNAHIRAERIHQELEDLRFVSGDTDPGHVDSIINKLQTKVSDKVGSYKNAFTLAQRFGIVDDYVNKHVTQNSRVSTDPIDQADSLMQKIIDFVRDHEDDANYQEDKDFKALKVAVNAIQRDNGKNDITKASLYDMSKELGYRGKNLHQNVEDRLAEIKEERKGKTPPYKGRFKNLTHDDELRRAIYCEIKIGEEAMPNTKAHLQKMFDMILDGKIADMATARAEEQALAETMGIDTTLDIDIEINESTQRTNDAIEGVVNVDTIINKFPPEDREDLRNAMLAGHARGESCDLALINAIRAKYGDIVVDHTRGITLGEVLESCTTEEATTIQIHGVDTPVTAYHVDSYRMEDILSDYEDALSAKDEKELSCCELQLGKKFTHDIYDMVREGGRFESRYEADFAVSLTAEQLEQEQDAQMRLNEASGLQRMFTICWEKAINAKDEKDINPLKKLLAKPADAADMPFYNQKLQILRDLGIEVDEIIKNLSTYETRMAAASTEEEKANILLGTARKFNEQEQMYGFILTSKETVAQQLRDFDDMMMMHRATNETDRSIITELKNVETAVDESTNILAKLRKIHNLKHTGAINETVFQNVLVFFAQGQFNDIQTITPHLKGMRFSRQDPGILAKIGITPANIAELTMDEITEMVKRYIEEQSAEYKRISESASGRAERGQEKPDGERQKTNPRKMKNRIFLVGKLFGNIKTGDELTKAKRAEIERLGLDKTVLYEDEALAGANTLDSGKEDKKEGEAEAGA